LFYFFQDVILRGVSVSSVAGVYRLFLFLCELHRMDGSRFEKNIHQVGRLRSSNGVFILL